MNRPLGGPALGETALATLTIPPRYAAGMAKIISLPDDSIEEIATALSEVTPSLDLKALASEVSSRVKSVARADISRIVRLVVSLYSARAYSDPSSSSIDEFVDDICEALSRSGRKELEVTEENKERVKGRLRRMLSLEALDVASKALSLQHEHEHVYCNARILTDARPVYGPNPNAAPQAAVVTHTLKLMYHKGDQLREIYIALDGEDIKQLRTLLDRAESKASSHKSLFDSAKLLIFS